MPSGTIPGNVLSLRNPGKVMAIAMDRIRSRHRISRFLRHLAVSGLSATLVASLIQAPFASAAPPGEEPWPLQRETPIPGHNAVATPRGPNPADVAALTGPRTVTWPKPGVAEVDLPAGTANRPAVKAGDLPVRIGAADSARVRVEVLDRSAAAAAQRDGLLLRVGRIGDALRTRPTVSVEVDYSGFRYAYGGDWGARLRLSVLPECALSTPEQPQCNGIPLPTRNDATAGRLVADVAVADAKGSDATGTTGGTLLAVTASSSGTSGSFAASSLSLSGTWDAGGATGDFSWTYPLRVPPSPGSLEPDLSLAYSSSNVDGRTTATNNQPSWIGEGFEMWSGYIERRYKPCMEDMGKDKNSDANNTVKTGDLCWATENATMSLSGSGGELIKDDATGTWRMRSDNGAKIELLTGATNGDNNGEYWKVTTADGTQYFFGQNRLPGWVSGKQETKSAWTVPVYGNHATEPCHASTFDASYCDQAWRWNLDHVIDRHGDTISFFYTPETNKYGRNLSSTKVSSYERDGVLEHIEYGQREGQVYTTPAVGKVVFTPADRCVPGTTCSKTDKSAWPDVPWDQECSGSTCTDKYSPTFWTAKRLEKVTTQVYNGSGYDNVDEWTLRHTYPDPGDGTRAGLFLAGVTHKGVRNGGIAMPEVTFDGVQLPNRVDGIDGIPAMNWWRIKAIHTDTGSEVAVTYSAPDCAAPGDLPAPDTNTRRCYPVRWQPESMPERQDWFRKYVVTEVAEHDRTTGLQPVVTRYEYVGGAAWRKTDDDGLTKDKYHTWSQWRGYSRVITRLGNAADGPVTKTETLYMRGMNGDKTATGGTKTVTVTASEFGPINDDNTLAGFARETITYLGDTSTVVSRTINDPWVSPATATSARSWGTRHAYVQGVQTVNGRSVLEGGVIRRTRSESTFTTVNGRPGVLSATNDVGDIDNPNDDKCVRYEYADSTTKYLRDVPTRVVTYSVSCSVTPTPADVLTDTRNYYDGKATLGAVETGNLTRTEKLAAWNGSTPVYQTVSEAVYDAHGRVVEAYDSGRTRVTTTYTPTVGGPVTREQTTNTLGHTQTEDIDPAWGATVKTTDANGRVSEAEYDALGRVVKVWQPGRTRGTDSPNVEYGYLIRTDGPNVVTTRALKHNGSYLTTYELYDGLMRERQEQQPAPGGGRVVIDTVYNSRGEAVKENGPYYNDAPPGFDVLLVDEATLPGQNVTLFDGVGRETAEIFLIQGVEQWRTTITHGGDRTHTTPPAGDSATTEITDSRGQTIELRQYQGSQPTGTYDATRYTYTKRGELSTVTDSAGNVWKYFYNVRGQKYREEDPARGVTTYTYDDATDELATVTDARGKTLAYKYDALGRQVAVHEGSLAGPKLAEWTYDTLLKGELTSSTRWHEGNAYTSAVTGYDDADRATGVAVTIPASEGSLAGTYTYGLTYNIDNSPATSDMPAVGGLPAETMSYGYDSAFSLPTTLSSNLGSYVTGSTYTPYGEPWQVTTSTDATGATKWVRTTYEYHVGSRRIGRVLVERDGSPMRLANTTYTWDSGGNLTKVQTDATGIATDAQCFKYDQLGRLTTAWTPISNNCAYAPSASALGGPAPYYHSWTIDKTGNRLTETKYSTAGNTVATSTYPTSGSAKPHALSTVTTTGPGISRTDSYTYDAAGNLATRTLAGTTGTFDWNAEGHLTSVTESGKTTSFVYDADGNRLLRRDSTGTTLYLGSDEIRRDNAGVLSATRYYSYNGQTIAVRTSGTGNGTLHWLSADHHGTQSLAIKASDLSVQRRYSTPYGGSRGTAPTSWPGEKGFVGGTVDSSTGLVHLGAREYDPSNGRFISVDPIIDYDEPQQLNGYAYANNAPTSASDPDGLRWLDEDIKLGMYYCGCSSSQAQKRSTWRPGRHYNPRPYTPPPPPKIKPAPKPKKCGTFDLVCKGKKAVKATVNWADQHKATILTVTVSIAAGIGCGIVTAGAAAVACAVGAGAAISAASYHFTTPASQRSAGGYFGAAAFGAATGLIPGGRALAGAAKGLGGGAVKAVAGGLGKAAAKLGGAAKALGQGIKATANAVGAAAKRAGSAIASGAKKAGNAIASGAKKAVNGTKNTGQKAIASGKNAVAKARGFKDRAMSKALEAWSNDELKGASKWAQLGGNLGARLGGIAGDVLFPGNPAAKSMLSWGGRVAGTAVGAWLGRKFYRPGDFDDPSK